MRQGDPLSPYFLVVAMEILSKLMAEELFEYHLRCSRLQITRSFADDLLVFSAAIIKSMQTIKGVLQSFDDLLGLSGKPSKSSLFCAGINPAEKQKLIECLQIREGHLPIRYLGVPLITRKLMFADCGGILIDKISGKIDSWLANKFSFADRLQLAHFGSALQHVQSFWSGIFILSKKVGKILEHKFNWYLWSGSNTIRVRAKECFHT